MTTAVQSTSMSTPTPTPSASTKTLNALLHLPAQMELSQIELIYRAEGNANLVLALPQFKKVLRLPKMISSKSNSSSSSSRPSAAARPEGQPNVSDPTKASSAKAGVLTMPDFMAYIEIMRRLLGNEFVCAADIVAIPKESDRFWINEHIRAHRPVSRLDKEFVGPFGLLLPDVTQLPATFDVLLANLQAKDMNMDTDMDADICSGSTSSSSSSGKGRGSGSGSNSERSCGITRLGDTYAIEIKPKQGWLQLPSDVSDLFDLMPTGAGTMDTTYESEPDPHPNPDPAALQPQPQLQSQAPAEERARSKPDKCRCRYCCMQAVKLQTGKIKRLGQYCPLELFSGAPGRMYAALNALFACPQNNLRVFQSGNLIYGDHADSISCEELQTRIFPGEIMALIKHLLVACLLREYNQKEDAQAASANRSHVAGANAAAGAAAGAAFGESTFKRCCGTETKATATIEIGVANATTRHVAQELEQRQGAGKAEFVKAVAGQPQRRAAVETVHPRYTKRTKIAAATPTATATRTAAATTTTKTTQTSTTTTAATETTIGSTCLSANVAMAAARTEMETETETLATAAPSPKPNRTAPAPASASPCSLATSANPCETQARLNKAEIFHLPKNCVLQKILHLQLLVKRHFRLMWAQGHAAHATPTYEALRGLLSCGQDNVDEMAAEQAYMLGATALDCSIMLTFQEIRCPDRHASALQPWLVAVEGHQFLTKLSVLDLDPKPDSHFHKFIKQSREIEKCFRALN